MKFDPSGYWKSIGLKGDFEGHPFRGNQYTEGTAQPPKESISTRVHVHASHEMADRMLSAAKLGGFTVDFKTEEPVKKGIAVGVFPERSGIFDANKVTAGDIKEWLDKNEAVLNDPRIKVGGWLDDGKVWLDIVRVYDEQDKDIAIKIGQKKNQKAIADLGAISRGDWDNAFIDTGGTGMAKTIKQRRKGGVFMLFDSTVTADEIVSAIRKHKK